MDHSVEKQRGISTLKIPRLADNDYSHESAANRRAFIGEQTGASLGQVSQYSFDPAILPGNIENFIGVAQVPIGVAGPLRIDGEYAQGDFLVPLATTEGTLVASYSRGMRLLSESGGVKTTVIEQLMQRTPVFVMDDARQARELGHWVAAHFAEVKFVAEATTRVGKLIEIIQFAVGPMRHLRFNYSTGDAAGQNMTAKATYAACEWICQNYPGGARYILSGNTDTDKKYSRMSLLHTRGTRVVAEAVIKKAALREIMGVDSGDLDWAQQVSNAGSFMVGSANNGAHAANGLTALFIACGQDAASIAEAHAGLSYTRLLDNGDYYWSITLTSLCIGTYGGGTGLATQRDSLEMLGCYGTGNSNKFAEICAATVLAGETSVVGAILHGDAVSSHERYGRNR